MSKFSLNDHEKIVDEIIADIVESYTLAMRSANVPENKIAEITATVNDAIVNNVY